MSDGACGRPQTLGSSTRAESETGGGAFHYGQLSDDHSHQSQAGGQTFPRRNPHSQHWKEISTKDEMHILSCALKSITMKLCRNNAHFDLLRLTNHPCCLDVQRDCGFGSYECLSHPIKERKHSCQHALWNMCFWHISCVLSNSHEHRTPYCTLASAVQYFFGNAPQPLDYLWVQHHFRQNWIPSRSWRCYSIHETPPNRTKPTTRQHHTNIEIKWILFSME